MKTLFLILTIAISVNCMSQRKSRKPSINNLTYDVVQEDKMMNLNYREEISKVINEWAYITTSMHIIPWGEGHHHIVAGNATPRRLSASNPFIPVKFWDKNSDSFVDTIEVESIKAIINVGKKTRFKTIEATDKDLQLTIPTIQIEGKEYIMSSFKDVLGVCRTHGIKPFYYQPNVPDEWMNEVIFLVPYIKGRTEVIVKNSCGNITIINPDEIYIYIPKSLVVIEDQWLKPCKEMSEITASNYMRSEKHYESERNFEKMKKERQKRTEERERDIKRMRSQSSNTESSSYSSYSKSSSSSSNYSVYAKAESSVEVIVKEPSGYTPLVSKEQSSKRSCLSPNNKWVDERTGYVYTRICVKGDGLYGVGRRFNVKVPELLRLNPNVKARPGNTINFGEDIRIK